MFLRLARALAAIACFVLGAAGTCAAIGVLQPWHEEAGLLSAKLRTFNEGRGKYNVVFLGSSRIYRHVNPRTFDATASELGQATRSFNFGVEGMFAPEDSFWCEQLLTRDGGVRWVFVEVSQFAWPRIAEPAQPARVIAWHDWPRTLAACRAAWPGDARSGKRRKNASWRGTWEKLQAVWPEWAGHWRCFVRRATNMGRGAAKMGALLAAARKAAARDDTGQGSDGFAALTGPPGAGLEEYRRAVAERQQTPAVRVPLPAEAQRNLARMVEFIRRRGAEPILVSTPMPTPLIYLPEQTFGARLIDFNELRAYPALFQIEHRHDFGHLNAAGAEAFSKLLAQVWLGKREGDER